MASVDGGPGARATGLGARDYLVLSGEDAAALGDDLPVGLNAMAQQSISMSGADADESLLRDASMTWLLDQQLDDGSLPDLPGGTTGDAWSTALSVLTWSGCFMSADSTWETGYFPDALSGSALAGLVGGPVLLTRKDRLPQVTKDRLEQLEPSKIIVLGGTDTVSTAVSGELEAMVAQTVRTGRSAPSADRSRSRQRPWPRCGCSTSTTDPARRPGQPARVGCRCSVRWCSALPTRRRSGRRCMISRSVRSAKGRTVRCPRSPSRNLR